MNVFFEKYRDILLYLIGFFTICLYGVISLVVTGPKAASFLSILLLTAVFAWFFVFMQKYEVYFQVITEPYVRIIFLAGSFSFAVMNVAFNFMDIQQSSFHLAGFILVVSGFFTLYFNLEKIKLISKQEYECDEYLEKEREDKFVKKYSKLNILNIGYLRKKNQLKEHYLLSVIKPLTPILAHFARLPYNYVKWIYKQGWTHIFILTCIILLFFITRLYNNDFINASDNYNVIGLKNLYENGLSHYKYSPITDYLMLSLVKRYGFNFFTIKIPFLLYSFVTLIFIYLIGQLLDKNLALVSSFLYTISPWTIVQSRITRDYSFDLMFASISLYLCLIMYRKINETNDLKNTVKFLFLYSLIPLSVILVYKYNREQVLIVGIYALITFLFILEHFVKKFCAQKHLSLYWAVITILSLVAIYFVDRFPFNYGFKLPDLTFIEIYFHPLISSPWQWFYGNHLGMFFFVALFIVGFFSYSRQSMNKSYLLILFTSFIFGLLLYTFKYQTHIEYIPVRYTYFLFVPYVIIMSNAILNLVKNFQKSEYMIVVIFLISLVNPIGLVYSMDPNLMHENEGISTIKIDNLGIGRFDVLETVTYLERELQVSDDTVITFGGRYEEFILYLNRPMDKDRYLLRDGNLKYDIAENTYVESDYFNYHELKIAVSNNSQGLYVANEKFITDDTGIPEIYLVDDDFSLYGTNFRFLANVEGYRIYSWNYIET